MSSAAGGVGGVFTGTYGGIFNSPNGIAINATAASSGSNSSYGGVFLNNGGGSGDQAGISVTNQPHGEANGYGGVFYNTGGGNGYEYGILATSGSGWGIEGDSFGDTNAQQSAGVVGTGIVAGGVFTATFSSGGSGVAAYGGGNSGLGTGGGSGVTGTGEVDSSGAGGPGASGYGGNGGRGGDGIIGHGAFSASPNFGGNGITGIAGADQSGNPGYDGYFDAFIGSNNYTSVYAQGHLSARAYDTHTSYDMVVEYHGTQPLKPGDVLAFDGTSRTVHGEVTQGVVKATSANSDLAMGVAQYPMQWQDRTETTSAGKTLDSGGWHIDSKAANIQPGDTLTVVVMGVTQMKVGAAPLGSHLTLDRSGNQAVADKSNLASIGKVIGSPDQNGYASVFVNFK